MLGAVLLGDTWVSFHMRLSHPFWTVLTAVLFVADAAYLIILMYVFPLEARFKNNSLPMIRNAFMVGMRYLLCTALQAGIYFLMLLTAVRFFTPILMFGEGLCAFLCSYVLNGILLKLEEDAPREEETLYEGTV